MTVHQLEAGRGKPRRATLALETAGVSFIEENGGGGPGVRLQKREPSG